MVFPVPENATGSFDARKKLDQILHVVTCQAPLIRQDSTCKSQGNMCSVGTKWVGLFVGATPNH
jgi:hypothetical protein